MIPGVQLVRRINLSRFGSDCMLAGDINKDGRAEFIFCQGPGMLTADIFKPGAKGCYGSLYTTPEDQALDCMTAIDLDGRILWQRGDPWSHDIPFRTHGGERMALLADINGDGADELVRIRGNQLQLLDGANGKVLAATTLDNDGYSQLLTASFTGDVTRQIVVKPVGDGLDGHPHGCPVVAFDCELKPFWPRRDFTRAGHWPVAFDVDGDGRDELLIGFDCAGPDGSVRWTLPIADGVGHPDLATVADVNDDGIMEQVLACEDAGVIVTDLMGHVLWRRPADHCGEACVGKYFSDRPGRQILVNNEFWRVATEIDKMGSAMLDGWGQTIWESPRDIYGLAINWPAEVGPQALIAKPHAVDPDDARPFVMDGLGRTLATFDIPLRLTSRTAFNLPHVQYTQEQVVWGDWGDYYSHEIRHLDGVGDCILIWSRQDLWIFSPRCKDRE
jgi:hypothetical protein